VIGVARDGALSRKADDVCKPTERATFPIPSESDALAAQAFGENPAMDAVISAKLTAMSLKSVVGAGEGVKLSSWNLRCNRLNEESLLAREMERMGERGLRVGYLKHFKRKIFHF
jgi:hypothetical protein